MMKKIIYLSVIAACLTACGNSREEKAREVREKTRKQFFEEKLREVQAEMVRTDSLLKLAREDKDTFNVQKRIYLDSLKMEYDIQGARRNYILEKQKELL